MNKKESNVVPKQFKALTCKATLCIYYKWRATCIADYLELDEQGVCIHFTERKGGTMNKTENEDLCGFCGQGLEADHNTCLQILSTTGFNRQEEDIMREKVADLCHKQWSGWMKYLFSKCFAEVGQFDKETGNLVIPRWAVERWHRQMKTPYVELSGEEKESDWKEADKFLELFSYN